MDSRPSVFVSLRRPPSHSATSFPVQEAAPKRYRPIDLTAFVSDPSTFPEVVATTLRVGLHAGMEASADVWNRYLFSIEVARLVTPLQLCQQLMATSIVPAELCQIRGQCFGQRSRGVVAAP